MQNWLNINGGNLHPTTFYMDSSLSFVHHSQFTSTSCEIECVYSIITCYSIFTKYKILELARPKKKSRLT